MGEIMSFETDEKRVDFFDKKSDNCGFDAFEVYENIDLKELSGNLDSNIDDLTEKSENGWTIFIRADSIYSDNLIIGFI